MLTYQICQNHVQRLRMFVEVASVPGSRGQDPGAITTPAHLRPSNPRCESMRLCKSEPWVIAVLKRYGNTDFPQISAQIAAFLHRALSQRANTTTKHNRSNGLEAGRETFPPLIFQTALNSLSVITDVMPPLPQAGEESTITSPRPLAGEVDCAQRKTERGHMHQQKSPHSTRGLHYSVYG